jgi:hypothetical protein
MKTVAEYRQFAAWCRDLAAKITDPKDKHATELMAEVANESRGRTKTCFVPRIGLDHPTVGRCSASSPNG